MSIAHVLTPDAVIEPEAAAAVAPRAVDVLLQYLEVEGVTCMFGIPGGNLLPLYEAMADRAGPIRPILTKHEEGGAFMADGYARVSRSIGVCCGIAGPGATHALTGVAGAFVDSVPMLFLSGQVATNVFGRGAIQDSTDLGVNLVEIFRPVTKQSTMLVNAASTPRIVQMALRTALSGRMGPVHLNLPGDVSKASVNPELVGAVGTRLSDKSVDSHEIARAASLLAQAKRPAILAGNGVNLTGAWAELQALAERLGIPVATTPKGKGAFPENHPLALGVFGFGGHSRAMQYLAGEVDTLLVVGSSLGEFQTNAWDKKLKPSQALIQIDVDAREMGKNYPVDVAIIADARVALGALDAELARMGVRGTPGASLPESLRDIPFVLEGEMLESDALPLKPQRVVGSLRRLLPEDALVFVDIGNCIAWMVHYFEVRTPGTFFMNLGFACMGWSIPAAIGGQLARPEATCVSVLGDGAFAMMGMEIHTAVEYALPVVWVVLNDSGFGMVEQGDKLVTGRSTCPARYQTTIDVCTVARGLGAASFRVRTPDEFDAALTEALAMNRPCVIDARIDPVEIPAPGRVRAETLRNMFEAG